MSKSGYIKALSILFLIFITSCMYAIRYDGAYRGKVIDAETGEPIEGVVVLGVWSKGYPTPGGTVHEFYDARETVTDANGEFSIPGMRLRIMSNLEPMDVLIFKAGYEYLGLMPWISLKEDILLNKKIKWEENKAIIPLRKLSMEERKRLGTPSFSSEAYREKKIPLLIKEINKEEIEFGRQPYPEE